MTQLPTSSQNKSSPHSFKLIIPTPISTIVIPQNHRPQSIKQTQLQLSYNAYYKLVKENTILNNQLNIIQRQKGHLQQKLDLIKREQDEKRKRHRRTAEQISKNFICPVESCNRSYGSQGSLLQHIKLKHQVYFNSEEYQSLLLSKNKKNKDRLITYSLNHNNKE